MPTRYRVRRKDRNYDHRAKTCDTREHASRYRSRLPGGAEEWDIVPQTSGTSGPSGARAPASERGRVGRYLELSEATSAAIDRLAEARSCTKARVVEDAIALLDDRTVRRKT